MFNQEQAQSSRYMWHGNTRINGKTMFNSPMAPSGSQTSRYQTQHIQRSRGAGVRRIMTARRPMPPRTQVQNRASTPSTTTRAIPGYAGHVPGKSLHAGGMSERGICEILDYGGMPFQPMMPLDIPVRGNTHRFYKDTIVPGYQGHVPKQRFTQGNHRVPGFSRQYKGEVQRDSVLHCPTYMARPQTSLAQRSQRPQTQRLQSSPAQRLQLSPVQRPQSGPVQRPQTVPV